MLWNMMDIVEITESLEMGIYNGKKKQEAPAICLQNFTSQVSIKYIK